MTIQSDAIFSVALSLSQSYWPTGIEMDSRVASENIAMAATPDLNFSLPKSSPQRLIEFIASLGF